MENTITLPISKRVVVVKSVLNTKEVRTAKNELGQLIDAINAVIDGAPTTEQATIISSKSDRQDEIVAEALLKRCELKQEDIDEMPYADGLYCFSKLMEISQIVPKN